MQTAAVSVGNPINVVTGNKYQRETDLTLPGALAPEFTRHYNSHSKSRGPLGHGWTHSYSANLEKLDDGRLVVHQSDGRTIVFRKESGDAYGTRLVNDGHVTPHKSFFIWHWRNGRAFTFNAEGKLLRIEAPTGEALALTYDRAGRLLQITDNQNRQLAFSYYPNGRLQTVLDPAGAKSRYTYDQNGNLATATTPDNTARVYHYEDRRDVHNLTGITDARGIRYATWAYDEQDRAVLSTHADDVGKVTLKFGKDQTRVTNSLGQASVYRTQVKHGISLVTAVEGPGCSACGGGDIRYGYDDSLQLTTITNKDGMVTHRVYDKANRLTEVTQTFRGEKPTLVARYDYEGIDTQPARILRPSIVPGKEQVAAFSYNRAGQIISLRESGFAPNEKGEYSPITRNMAYVYDEHYRPVAIDGPRTDIDDVTRLAYDKHGRLDAIHYPGGTTKRVIDWDAYGRPAVMESPGQARVALTYNTQGQLLGATQGRERIQYAYGPDGRLATVTRPDGQALTISYDPAGRPIAVKDSAGNEIKQALDTEDRVLTMMVQDSTKEVLLATLYLRDPEGRLKGVLTPEGLESMTGHDKQGRPVLSADGGGVGDYYVRTKTGQISATVAPDHGVTRYTQDSRRGISVVRDAHGRATISLRDDFDRTLAVRSPDTGLTRYRYDEASNLIEKIDSRGKAASYAYDAMNRRTLRKDTDGETKFTHTPTSIQAIGPAGEERFVYNPQGHLVAHERKIGKNSFATRYRYDDSTGKLKEQVLPDGTTLVFDYNETQGRVSAIKRKGFFLDDSLVKNIRYQPFGPVTEFTQGNSLKTSAVYNRAGRLTSLTSPVLGDFLYRYDARGQLIEIKQNDDTRRYGYDIAGRLASAAHGVDRQRFAYNQLGDRFSIAEPASVQSVAFKTASPRTSQAQTRPAMRYARDVAGYITQRGDQRFEYNDAGRPVKLYVGENLKAEYLYNPQGERIQKTLYTEKGTETTVYLYNEQRQLEAEADHQGNVTAQYVYLDGRPIAKFEGKYVYYLHTDHLGTPQAVTDEHQQVVWKAGHEAFGKGRITAHTKEPSLFAKVASALPGETQPHAFTLNLRFPGQYFDVESGTHYNYYRNYDPEQGRYLQPDPLGISQGMNLYAYVGNNPLQYSDPLGLFKWHPGVHQNILQTAFNQFNQRVPGAFSQFMIDQFINANRRTDTVGRYFFDQRNHFDNPHNDPPNGRWTGNEFPVWIKDSLDLINDRRDLYSSWGHLRNSNCTGQADISNIVVAFGLNTHALADFYAHSNWVDPPNRGGAYVQEVAEAISINVPCDPDFAGLPCGTLPTGDFTRRTIEEGTVPVGRGQNVVWDERVTTGLFTGNAEGECTTMTCAAGMAFDETFNAAALARTQYGHNVIYGTDAPLTTVRDGIEANPDMSTHAFWAKDHPDHNPGLIRPAGWTETLHERAVRLAIAHTLLEIQRLYDAADPGLRTIYRRYNPGAGVRINLDVDLSQYLQARPDPRRLQP